MGTFSIKIILTFTLKITNFINLNYYANKFNPKNTSSRQQS